MCDWERTGPIWYKVALDHLSLVFLPLEWRPWHYLLARAGLGDCGHIQKASDTVPGKRWHLINDNGVVIITTTILLVLSLLIVLKSSHLKWGKGEMKKINKK